MMLTLISLLVFFGGLCLLFANSPFYALFGVLTVALAHAGLLAFSGATFFSLLIVIVYAGGMLVVFLFSTILSADRYPFFSMSVFFPMLLGVFILFLPVVVRSNFFYLSGLGCFSLGILSSFADLYLSWGLVLIVVGGALLVALLGVLALSFEQGRKSLRNL